ncbi:polysaccharide biosynthesis protein [Scytonema hofmannii PCC 7110]|uniref:Polysaccharide biosynthesis protein n=1 Tax=Scytonema hofmannii PCC 7110 TaxID=128403 RepID=A0A139WST1_9CYAN|nr:oligosaccharide flippase family protein [Scytonema hofmannii]KYC35492.1 polysaccharide biosynthesis protein [Scytonema hofmannii PCC 7110]
MKLSAILKNGFWATYGAIATRFLALFSNLLLARLLLPAEFGVISTAYIFWAFGNLFNQGTSGSFIVYKGVEDKRYLDTTYTISLIIGCFLAVVLGLISPIAARYYSIPDLVWILLIFGFNLILSSFQSVHEGVLRRRMQYRELANSNLIASFVRVFSTIGSALLGLSYWSFVIGDTAGWITGCLLMHHYAKQKFNLRIYSEVRWEVLSYCLGNTGFSLGYFVIYNCDNFVVSVVLGTTSLAFYNLAYQLTMAITTILSQAMSQVGMSVFAQLEDDQQRENALVKVIEQTSFLAAPLYALFFLVVNQQTISFLFGTHWIPVCTVIPGLLIFAYSRLINSQLFSMLSAKGKPGVNAKLSLSIAPVAVLSFVLGARIKGIIGVSIAVAVVLGILWTIYCWWEACRQLNWSSKKFLIFVFKAPLITLLPIVVSLKFPEIIQPILFLIIYLFLVRLLAAKQFLQYQYLLGNIAQRLVTKWNSK